MQTVQTAPKSKSKSKSAPKSVHTSQLLAATWGLLMQARKDFKAFNLARTDLISVDKVDKVASEFASNIRNRSELVKILSEFDRSINIRIETSKGVIDCNGPRLASAILREDSLIIKGSVV